MDELTRRSFVKASAGAAVSASVLGAVAAPSASAAQIRAAEDSGSRPGTKPAEHNGLVAYLPDLHGDEIAVMHGEHTTIIHDRALAARLARHAR